MEKIGNIIGANQRQTPLSYSLSGGKEDRKPGGAVSTLVFTHVISYMDGTMCHNVNCTEQEANDANDLWGLWRPVPVPDPRSPERAARYMNPKKIEMIARINRRN